MAQTKKAWVLIQTLGENVNVSIVGVYDNRKDMERGIRSELEHFWNYLVGDLKYADENATIGELHKQAVDEGVKHLMEIDGFTLHGKNIRWTVQDVTMNENVE